MQTLESLLLLIIDKKKWLDEVKSQSPDIAEALKVSDLYHGLMEDLRKMCDTPAHIVPVPYPVRPFWESPAIYDATCTVGMWPSTIRIVK